ncbi:MAG: exostosin family protein [Acidobacteria bacterium]|nr:exostosin family protein [Acidobacteriota bacterium]
MESSYLVSVPAPQAYKFEYLQQFFPFTFSRQPASLLSTVSVSHREPLTRIGSIVRPLIFPRSIVQRSRAMWQRQRPIRFLFTGLLTSRRIQSLEGWLGAPLPEPASAGPPRRAGHPDAGLRIEPSTRGREFPAKSWDDPYHALTASAQFVLCPPGDYVWTYRFFEAIFCGAMPVVEEPAPCYEGFAFATFSDDPEGLTWSQEIAAANFARAAALLTIMPEELDEVLRHELGRLESSEATPAAEWMEAIEAATRELTSSMQDEIVMLVDDAQLPMRERSDTGAARRVHWFLEKNGQYFGPPADDQTAIEELEREKRKFGAHFLAIAFPAFWWLQHYVGFAAYLRRTYACVRENELLVIFDLRAPPSSSTSVGPPVPAVPERRD